MEIDYVYKDVYAVEFQISDQYDFTVEELNDITRRVTIILNSDFDGDIFNGFIDISIPHDTELPSNSLIDSITMMGF